VVSPPDDRTSRSEPTQPTQPTQAADEPTYAAGPASRHTPAPVEGPEAVEVDWEALRRRAVELMERAYAPYSQFPVGVAGLVDDGRVVAGCNVENAAYGVTLCAECGMVSELHATGGGRLTAVYCVGRDGRPLMACGRCRQLLWENGGPRCLVMTPRGVLPMSEVLPQAFGPDNLAHEG
jgi:cytidine deaminase